MSGPVRWCDCPGGPTKREDCPPHAYTDGCDWCDGLYYVETMSSPSRPPEMPDVRGPTSQQIADSLAIDVLIETSIQPASLPHGEDHD